MTWSELASPGPIYGSLASLGRQCDGGAILAPVIGQPAYKVFSSLDYGQSWQLGQVAGITAVAAGPDCAFFAVRPALQDTFVTKLPPGGKEIVWSTFLGGSNLDSPSAIALDAQGNVYVAGKTNSSDFPTTLAHGSPGDIGTRTFAVKYDSDGNLQYSVAVGSSSLSPTGISVNAPGEAHVAGVLSSPDLPTTPGGAQSAAPPNTFNNGFALKLSPLGDIVYLSYLVGFANKVHSSPGTHPPIKVGVAAEASGSALYGGNGGMLARMSPDGTQLSVLPTELGNISFMDSDAKGDIYVAGQFTAGAVSKSCYEGLEYRIPVYLPPGDVFIAKLENGTLRQIFSKRIGGDCESWPEALRVTADGEIGLAIRPLGNFPIVNALMDVPDYSTRLFLRLASDGSTIRQSQTS